MRHSVLSASLRTGLETLRLNPLRTLLSTLGIIMGVAALVAVLSLGDGMQNFAREQIERTTDLQAVSVQPVMFRTVEGQRVPRSDVLELSAADADSIARIAGDGAVTRLLMNGNAIVTTATDSTPRITMVSGTLASVGVSLDSAMLAGRFFDKQEEESGAPVVVVSDSLLRRVKPGVPAAEAIGDTLLFQGAPRVVVGVFRDAEEYQGTVAIMPIAAARTAMAPAMVGRAPAVAIKAPGVERVKPIRDSVRRYFERQLGSTWSERVSVVNNESRLDQVQQGMLLFKLFMGALTGISLLVGGIGIMNVLLASVVERTREIGIRRATGAQRRDVMLQFLSESVTITAAGSAVGLVIGVSGAYAVTAIMRSYTKAEMYAGFSLSTFLVAVIASMVIGLGFGIYPAVRASRLSPIDAIRHE